MLYGYSWYDLVKNIIKVSIDTVILLKIYIENSIQINAIVKLCFRFFFAIRQKPSLICCFKTLNSIKFSKLTKHRTKEFLTPPWCATNLAIQTKMLLSV